MADGIERIESGPRMSQAVAHGGLVFLAGQIADDASASIAEQTRQVLAKVDRHLAAAGTDKARILSANIWLVDMADFQAMNAVWDGWVAPGEAPARATVQSGLALPGLKVEIAVIAAR